MRPQRIIRPATAFSVAPTKQKRPREHNEKHLAFVRGLKCCLCGAPGPDPAHIRSASPIHGKRETGGSERPADKFTVPLCRKHHDEQHAGNELLFWAKYRIDPFTLALSLFAASGDEEIAEAILNSHLRR